MPKALMLHEGDSVATLLERAEPGEEVEIMDQGRQEAGKVKARSTIPFGHKIALRRMEKDSLVVKAGAVIGKASRDIEPGEHVHIQNLISIEGRRGLQPER